MVPKSKPNLKDYKNTPQSKLSKQAYVTKPETRHPKTHSYGVGQAESMVKKLG